MPDIHTLVLVEGESDAAAVRALAGLFGRDLEAGSIQIRSAGGVTNFPQSLAELARTHPRASFCGLYDIAEERYVRRALVNAGISEAADESLEPFGFCACVADLEDELIRALGAEAVQNVLEGQGELPSFRVSRQCRITASGRWASSCAGSWARELRARSALHGASSNASTWIACRAR